MIDFPLIITRTMPVLVSVLYAITAFAFLVRNDLPWALVWASYALANLGLILAEVNR